MITRQSPSDLILSIVSLLSDQKFTDSENMASHSEVGVAGHDSAVRYGFETRNFIS